MAESSSVMLSIRALSTRKWAQAIAHRQEVLIVATHLIPVRHGMDVPAPRAHCQKVSHHLAYTSRQHIEVRCWSSHWRCLVDSKTIEMTMEKPHFSGAASRLASSLLMDCWIASVRFFALQGARGPRSVAGIDVKVAEDAPSMTPV